MTDIFIDLESTSLKPNAGIVSIGAFKFNRHSVLDTTLMMESPEENFYVNVDLTSQYFHGFDLDPKTAEWWRTKNAHQINVVLKGMISLKEALQKLVDFIQPEKKPLLFCRRTHADWVWLNHAFGAMGWEKNPIPYNGIVDVASMVLMQRDEPKGYIELEKQFDAHHALGDCHRDALIVATLFEERKGLIPL